MQDRAVGGRPILALAVVGMPVGNMAFSEGAVVVGFPGLGRYLGNVGYDRYPIDWQTRRNWQKWKK